MGDGRCVVLAADFELLGCAAPQQLQAGGVEGVQHRVRHFRADQRLRASHVGVQDPHYGVGGFVAGDDRRARAEEGRLVGGGLDRQIRGLARAGNDAQASHGGRHGLGRVLGCPGRARHEQDRRSVSLTEIRRRRPHLRPIALTVALGVRAEHVQRSARSVLWLRVWRLERTIGGRVGAARRPVVLARRKTRRVAVKQVHRALLATEGDQPRRLGTGSIKLRDQHR